MKIQHLSRGLEATATLPVVQGIPIDPPPDDGSGEAVIRWDASGKQAVIWDVASSLWKTAGGSSLIHVDSTMTGDGSAGSPLHALPTFGPDTIVDLNNSLSNPVHSLEVVTSLTTATAGSEASKWVIKLLSASLQVTAMDIRPTQVLLPDGAAAGPGFAFQSQTNTGMYRDNVNGGRLFFARAGVAQFLLDGVNCWSLATSFLLGGGGDASIFYTANRALQLKPNTTVSGGDVVIGPDGALSTSTDTGGYLQIPTCAGQPTATLGNIRTGKVSLVFDTTNSKINVTAGGGTWLKTAALT